MCVILQEWLNCAINMDHLLHSLRHVHVRSFLSFTKDDKNSHTVSHCRSSLRLYGPANFVKFIFFYFSTFLFCRIIMSYFLVKVRDFILSYIFAYFSALLSEFIWIYSEIYSEYYSEYYSDLISDLYSYFVHFSDFYSDFWS